MNNIKYINNFKSLKILKNFLKEKKSFIIF